MSKGQSVVALDSKGGNGILLVFQTLWSLESVSSSEDFLKTRDINKIRFSLIVTIRRYPQFIVTLNFGFGKVKN